jgi:hypothetical protein
MAKNTSVITMCKCRGEHCVHHRKSSCPNRAVPPISSLLDGTTGKPVPGSEYGLCEVCWDVYYAHMDRKQKKSDFGNQQ